MNVKELHSDKLSGKVYYSMLLFIYVYISYFNTMFSKRLSSSERRQKVCILWGGYSIVSKVFLYLT